ncbi:MAG: hypothetical protein NPIRA02_04530 [Nitrospirales bacterium]|nr:MAG: hypothetical protein NPIRA02_04530 [Nitrospirales bacterium]
MKMYLHRQILKGLAAVNLILVITVLQMGSIMAQSQPPTIPLPFDPATIDPSTLPGAKLPLYKGRQFMSLDEQKLPENVKQSMRRDVEQMRQQGFLHAEDAEVLKLDRRHMNRKKSQATKEDLDAIGMAPTKIKEALDTIGIVPTDITETPLATAKLIDVSPNGSWFIDKWTGLSRLFVVKGFGLVSLDEFDFTIGNGGVAVAEELCNEFVNAEPAALRVKESPAKRGITELVWVTEKRLFTLTVNRPLKSRGKVDQFIELAESLH